MPVLELVLVAQLGHVNAELSLAVDESEVQLAVLLRHFLHDLPEPFAGLGIFCAEVAGVLSEFLQILEVGSLFAHAPLFCIPPAHA